MAKQNKEISEVLLDITEQLKRNNGDEWDLTDDSGKAIVFDTKLGIFIPDVILSKDGTPCAIIPLEHLEEDTIRAIAKIMLL